ncbi:MAG: Gfo/Idh/MocA family oxidoreductase [Clostridia bacterium]|nr:Gfo/Idh/MocA family oxidoreductase [Clostridia bacterium]
MKKFKIGVLGMGRGIDLAENLSLHKDCEVVAFCEFDSKRAAAGLKEFGREIPVFEDFDAFLEQDLDAVVLANYFHEHTPFAIKCFKKNIHVLCECISNSTMAEGVELLRAYEKSKSIYMLAENYPQMKFNREMKHVCDGGTLGKIIFAEGEYNHPVDPEDSSFLKGYLYFPEHWRNYLPRTYYITHSLAPLMWVTGATPKRVSALPVFAPMPEKATARMVGDRAAIITTMNDDKSVFRVTGCASFGAHHNAYRFCGENGQIENLRGMDGKVMLRYNHWSVPEGKEENNLYEPSWNDGDEELIENAGHGGGDFIVARMFLDCLRENRQPEHPYDIYSAVTMSGVAILGHRSLLGGGQPYDIPDFRNEEIRKQYENDCDTPFFGSDGSRPTVPCCSKTDYAPSEEQFENYKKVLES